MLLKGWLEWREGVFARLNGMWAIAIYDAERDAIVLSRDRFGEKPLFWTSWRGGVAFASEVKQLGGFPDVAIELNLSRAAAYPANGPPVPRRRRRGSRASTSSIPARRSWSIASAPTRRYCDLAVAVAAVEPSADRGEWQQSLRGCVHDVGPDAAAVRRAGRHVAVRRGRQLGRDGGGDGAGPSPATTASP